MIINIYVTNRYMKRRCQFLDSLPTFNYNTGGGEYTTDEEGRKILTDTKQLGSTLMKAMLKEVSDFCDPDIKKKWRLKSHQQVSVESLTCIQYTTIISILAH